MTPVHRFSKSPPDRDLEEIETRRMGIERPSQSRSWDLNPSSKEVRRDKERDLDRTLLTGKRQLIEQEQYLPKYREGSSIRLLQTKCGACDCRLKPPRRKIR